MRDIGRTMQLQLQKIRYKITIPAQQYDKNARAVGEKVEEKKLTRHKREQTRKLTI